MIALDTSAVVAIALDEDEAETFDRAIASGEALIGTPTLLETRLVLMQRMPGFAAEFLKAFISPAEINSIPFTFDMYQSAAEAFERYGKGRGHPAQLNFGDCMAYAVAKHYDVPLLYKGRDFARTDIRPALP
jgi:ribonuclease VapC